MWTERRIQDITALVCYKFGQKAEKCGLFCYFVILLFLKHPLTGSILLRRLSPVSGENAVTWHAGI